jgi:hypothetical protein
MKATAATKEQLRFRLALRSSNAAVPIPQGKHKKPRARVKQELRKEYATGKY